MKLERNISAAVSEATLRERLATYFALAGYTQTTSQPQLLTYGRGSFFTFSAKGSKVNAIIKLIPSPGQPTSVTVTFVIDTTGQFVTKSERKFWQNELDDLERAIQTGEMDVRASAKETRSLLAKSLIAAAVIISLAIILAIGARFLF